MSASTGDWRQGDVVRLDDGDVAVKTDASWCSANGMRGGDGWVDAHAPVLLVRDGVHWAPSKPAAASTGDWWHNTIEALMGAGFPISRRRDEDARVWAEHLAAAVLPLFVAEATRRIEPKRPSDSTDWKRGVNTGIAVALRELAGLAGEVGQQ